MSTKKSTEGQIHVIMDELAEFIVRKNITYGDSLQNPVRVFSKATGVESISGRIDDKLSRIQAVGVNDDTIDTVKDLIGYFVHLIIAYEKDR